MDFIYTHLEPGAIVPFYCDTDSIFLGVTQCEPRSESMTPEEKLRAVFDPIVRADMKESWEANWKSWFVTTNEIEDQRKPGKLKGSFTYFKSEIIFNLEEYCFYKGRFIALSPKCYFAVNEEESDEKKKYKRGSKGIPHSEHLTMTNFVEQLYGQESHYVTLRTLRLNKNKKMSRFTLRKRGLNDLFMKFHVDDDAITCTPLTKKRKVL